MRHKCYLLYNRSFYLASKTLYLDLDALTCHIFQQRHIAKYTKDVETRKSKKYRSMVRSTLPFPAARGKLLNDAPSMRVDDKHPRPFRFSFLSDETSDAVTYAGVSISE
ncbi:hypothetical protein ALC62_12029 [Cyphomyrmex costatus]|uniref:Uncharacterized protein n=1 Tax=Cyphomyrmex costatus TaxID=456900 RepID=A0A195CAS2_9HYME|nr:hypothetical protein ALC62_12029 [Cyphomyrmex costatus]